MSDYREEINKYKAKRTGQTDAKVVAPKGRKKKAPKPWAVLYTFFFRGLSSKLDAKPFRHEFAKEEDARHEYDKRARQGWYKDVWIEYNGERYEGK
jgi:hypothetical protein